MTTAPTSRSQWLVEIAHTNGVVSATAHLGVGSDRWRASREIVSREIDGAVKDVRDSDGELNSFRNEWCESFITNLTRESGQVGARFPSTWIRSADRTGSIA